MACWGVILIVVLIVVVISIATTAFQFATGKRRRKSSDFVVRASVPLIKRENLVCPACAYSLRGLPENEADHIGCPECGAKYRLDLLQRPCWAGPRHKVPKINLATWAPGSIIVLAFAWAILLFVGYQSNHTVPTIATLGGLFTLLAIFVASVGHCGCASLHRSHRMAMKLEALTLLITICQIAIIGLVLFALFGGIASLATMFDSPRLPPQSEVMILIGIGLGIAILIGVLGLTSKRLNNYVTQQCLSNYVRRINEGVDPFPGLNLYWVLDGNERITEVVEIPPHIPAVEYRQPRNQGNENEPEKPN